MLWYEIENIGDIDSPSLVIFKDRVQKNIETLVSMVDGIKRLRPHVKTNKTIEPVEMLINAGVKKFKCATIAEAEMLGICKAEDVILAYQPVGPKINRLIDVIQRFPNTHYSCLVDNIDAAKKISESFQAEDLSIPVFIDLNVGMNRTGITVDKAAQLYKECSRLKGLVPVGLHMYDGHIRDQDFQIRKEKCDKGFDEVMELKNTIVKNGFKEPLIVAGGSPTFSIHSKRKKVECSPGTFIYWDKGYSTLCPEQNFLPAALVISRVISLPASNKICTDLGHKSIAAENEIARRVEFLNAPELKPVSQSEEHLVMEAAEEHSFKPGDVLYGLPFHVCPTIALYDRALIVENGCVTGSWKTIARDRKISI